MLSKVISGRNRALNHPVGNERIEAAVFHAVDGRYSQPPAHEPHAESASETEAELQGLREQVRTLKAEITVAKRDSHEAGRQQGEQQSRAEIAPVIERMN